MIGTLWQLIFDKGGIIFNLYLGLPQMWSYVHIKYCGKLCNFKIAQHNLGAMVSEDGQ